MKKLKAEILEFPRQIMKLLKLIEKTQEEIMIVSPFYSKPEIDEILRRLSKNVKLRALVRADTDSDIGALKRLCKKGEVKAAPNLHAKILIFDRSIAFVSSLNLDSSWERGSLDVGVSLGGKACKKLVALVDGWWEKGGQVSQKEISRLETAQAQEGAKPPPGPPHFSLGKRIPVPIFKPKVFDERHLILNINWNPHDYRRACTLEEAKKNISCHKRRRCLNEEWTKDSGGCTSSYLFEDFEYATAKSAIKKGRLVFFIAKNPNLKNEYYLVGFFYMKSSRPGKRAWGKTLFCFKGDEKKSIRFPSSGNKVIRLDRDFKKKFASRRNPQYFPRSDAMSILKKYFEKTRDRRAKEILKEDFGERM